MNALVGNASSAKCHRNVSMDIENRLNTSMKIQREQAGLACITMILLSGKSSVDKRIYSTSRSIRTRSLNRKTATRDRADNRADSTDKTLFDEVFDELIDSNFFYTEGSSFKFGNQAAGRTIVKGNNDSIPFFSNAGYSTWSERSSSVSEDSEVETSYQAPGMMSETAWRNYKDMQGTNHIPDLLSAVGGQVHSFLTESKNINITEQGSQINA
ncbi:hypothetical protein N7491_004471 [Penicillium cf. griseofulvum]|nr:hypothetical protein N7491_004471 [Penicillium cf. griseofulvum]